jgi:putative DNA primase/helicase
MAPQDPQSHPNAPSAAQGAPRELRFREPPRPAVDRLVTGELVRHGPARYLHEPNGTPSYFITVRTDRGERTLWGREIERALADSRTKPKPGDQVGVRENASIP